MNKSSTAVLFLAITFTLTSCSEDSARKSAEAAAKPAVAKKISASRSDVLASLQASIRAKNIAGMDRVEQTNLQKACSNRDDSADAQADEIRKAAENAVVYPADGDFLGDWRNGQSIAANGRGMQYTDDPAQPNGGNCYACHELSADEVSFGTIGPSLRNYGARGQSQMMLKYTWSKIWNPHVYMVCSHMPRFGDAGILTEGQIRDVMALLFDSESPVNK